MKTINDDKSISETYTEFLVRLREIVNEEQDGTSMCGWCGRPKNKHLPDARCSSWACSQYFTAKRSDERAKIERSLSLIEELRKLWSY